MSRMDDDLFTYEVKIPGLANILCDLKEEDDSEQHMTHGSDVLKEVTDHLMLNLLNGDDEVELTDEESSNSDDEDEVAEIFRIDTNILDFETPTFMNGLKMCHGCMKNHGLTLEYGKKPLQLNIIVSLLIIKMDVRSGQLVAGKMTDIVMDGKLKNEALKNKAIMEGMIDEDDESHNEGWRRWDDYENTIHDHEERENEGEHENKERCKLFDNPHHETPVCNIIRFEMIKYSFGEDEEYVVVKEHEYDDLTSTNEDACRAYHEIFRRMDEGWTIAGKKSTMLCEVHNLDSAQ
ncbi:hypothetical protein Tco_1507937 [Tanacetum coccineum]